MAKTTAPKKAVVPEKIIRGWLTKLDGYGNAISESKYIEFKLPKRGQIPANLKEYFAIKEKIKNVEVDTDDFYKGGLYYVNVPGVEDYYFCFETNEHIKKAKAARDEVYATPFACVG
jgi:hypothetical protein